MISLKKNLLSWRISKQFTNLNRPDTAAGRNRSRQLGTHSWEGGGNRELTQCRIFQNTVLGKDSRTKTELFPEFCHAAMWENCRKQEDRQSWQKEMQKNKGPLDNWGPVSIRDCSFPAFYHNFNSIDRLFTPSAVKPLLIPIIFASFNNLLQFSLLIPIFLQSKLPFFLSSNCKNVFQIPSRANSAALGDWDSRSTSLTVVPQGVFFSSKALLNIYY